jgi:hypothetical protein
MRISLKKAFIGSAAAVALSLAMAAFTAPVSAAQFVHGGGGGSHFGGGGVFHGSNGFQGGGMFHGSNAFQSGGAFHDNVIHPNGLTGSNIARGFSRDHDGHHHHRRFFAGGPFYGFDYGDDCAPYWNGYRYVYPYANGYACAPYGATY